MPLPTTRRGRYLARREKYKARKLRYRNHHTHWGRSALHKTARVGFDSDVVSYGKMGPQAVSSNTYNALVIDVGFPIPFVVTGGGPRRPPHVFITWGPYRFERDVNGWHPKGPFLGYHRRRVDYLPGHVKTVRRSKRDRQITGANWHFFRQGYFPDWDILGRHPNMTDADNGAPPAATSWPEPLGY